MILFELLTVFLLTVVNGLLALSEMAIASSRMAKLRAMAEQGVHGSRRAIVLASDPGRFLSTVQIGITLIGIIAGAVSGATLGDRFAGWLASVGVPTGIANPLGFGLVIGAITYVSLVIGELVPKQIALRNPERLACFVAPAMTLLAKIAAPVVWLLDRSGKLVLKLLGQSAPKDDTVTDAEIHSLIAEAETAGVIDSDERDMIAGVMRLGDRPVRTVMVPRQDVQLISWDEDLSDVGKRIKDTGHSRLVVYKDNPDNIVGVLQAKDIASAALRKRSLAVKQLIKQAPEIPDSADALDAIALLKESEVHFGIVRDASGSFEGIVTSADILQAIVGAFREEKRGEEPEIVERKDGSLLIAGWAPVDVALQRIGVPLPEKRNYQTMAGFVLDHMGRIPKPGDYFEEQGWRFEVVDLDGRRVDKLLVQKVAIPLRRMVKV
jgi:putative hemolysin